ncbi:MAG: radical SAM protein [Deferribacterota bacterium]|nr:radical SAM protein [Deferribacterota bacterium]
MLNRYLKRKRKYKFFCLQVEPTTRCQLKCRICPRSDQAVQWVEEDMPLALYKKLSDYFSVTKHVHLQGWGEPLLHKDIIEMVNIAKRAGSIVSLTTNGLLLDNNMIVELLKSNIDILAFSLGGSSDHTHSLVRGGKLSDMLNNISCLIAAKKKNNLKYPQIKFSYMMTKDNISELPEVLTLMKKFNIKELVATNLDYTPTSIQDELKLFDCSKVNTSYQGYLDKAKVVSRKLGITLKIFPIKMSEQPMCEASPIDTIFITVNGDVSPCVYLNLPVKGNIKRIFCDKYEEIKKLSFGNIDSDELSDIWESKAYKEFRDSFNNRIIASERILPMELTMAALGEYGKKYENMLKKYPLPNVCRSCYKAYGV